VEEPDIDERVEYGSRLFAERPDSRIEAKRRAFAKIAEIFKRHKDQHPKAAAPVISNQF
jgi:hypothetical protein